MLIVKVLSSTYTVDKRLMIHLSIKETIRENVEILIIDLSVLKLRMLI